MKWLEIALNHLKPIEMRWFEVESMRGREMVTQSGMPSGIAATASVTETRIM